MLSESGWGMFVGGQGSCLAQERAQLQCKANGYYVVVPMAGAALSLLDNLKMCKLKKKALVHQYSQNGRHDTVLTRVVTVVVSSDGSYLRVGGVCL